MIWSLLSLILAGCNTPEPQNLTLLIDISSSNQSAIEQTLKDAEEVYQYSGPHDKFRVFFFSSVKYLAYSGKKLAKDRQFAAILNTGYQKAKEISVESGTSFQICKEQIESAEEGAKIHLFTDGYFEDSDLTKINLPNAVEIKIKGLNIVNNERMLECFDDPDRVEIEFQGT